MPVIKIQKEMTVTDKIYFYFDKNPDLRVLFIFNDEFLAMELAEKATSRDIAMWSSKGIGLRQNTIWIPHGQTKGYHLFPSGITAATEIFEGQFPLLDVLTANMEYHHQDYVAYMQQYSLPSNMALFVEKNIKQLQSSRMLRLLQSYYTDRRSITPEIAVRAFLSSYFGSNPCVGLGQHHSENPVLWPAVLNGTNRQTSM